jgi:hypothetical protein
MPLGKRADSPTMAVGSAASLAKVPCSARLGAASKPSDIADMTATGAASEAMWPAMAEAVGKSSARLGGSSMPNLSPSVLRSSTAPEHQRHTLLSLTCRAHLDTSDMPVSRVWTRHCQSASCALSQLGIASCCEVAAKVWPTVHKSICLCVNVWMLTKRVQAGLHQWLLRVDGAAHQRRHHSLNLSADGLE